MYVYNSSTYNPSCVTKKGWFKKYIYTVGWKGIFNLWETILEDMFVGQLFFEKDLKQ